MNKNQQGFTLIELMIVIAIIGVLATIAIPQYQDFIIRAKLTEGLSLVEGAKTSVGVAFQSYGYIPATGNSASGTNSFDLPIATSISGQYVASVSVTGGSGVITVMYNNSVGGGISAADKLTLTPVTSPHGAIAWACGYASATAFGRTVGGLGSGTTIPSKYLPASCRG